MDKDFVRDQNPTSIYHADREVGLPDYVKQASFLTPGDLSNLHDTAFADRVKKLHPIHNKVAALLSGVYLAGNGETQGPVWDRVKSACEFYGVAEDLNSLASAFNAPKEASVDQAMEKWALQVRWSEEEVGSYYPINNAAEVKEAAVALDQDFHRNRIPIELYRPGCEAIVKAAAEYGVSDNEIPRTVKAAGVKRLPNLEYADLMLYTRKEAGVPDEGLELYRQCIQIAKEAATDAAVDRAIQIWRDLDEKHAIHYRKQANGRQVPSPYDCFYTGMTYEELEKTANEHVVLCGVMIPTDDFEDAVIPNNYEAVRREFGKEAAEQIIDALGNLGHYPCMEKAASTTSNTLGDLAEWQQKRLLGLVVNVKEAAPLVTPDSYPASPIGHGGGAMPQAGGGVRVNTRPKTAPMSIGHGAATAPAGGGVTVNTQAQPQQAVLGHGNTPMPQGNGPISVNTNIQQPEYIGHTNIPVPKNQGATVQVPPMQGPQLSDADWGKMFRKYHGGRYNASSSMDQGKLQQMKELYAQHGKLSPSLVYSAQYGKPVG